MINLSGPPPPGDLNEDEDVEALQMARGIGHVIAVNEARESAACPHHTVRNASVGVSLAARVAG